MSVGNVWCYKVQKGCSITSGRNVSAPLKSYETTILCGVYCIPGHPSVVRYWTLILDPESRYEAGWVGKDPQNLSFRPEFPSHEGSKTIGKGLLPGIFEQSLIC